MTDTTTITDEKRYGQHYTPRALAYFLARRALSNAGPIDGAFTVLDPACGDGELLLAASRAARDMGWSTPIRFIGHDIEEAAVDIARARLAAANLDFELVTGDFLAEQRLMPPGTIDLVITNPPYVRTQHLGQSAARLLAAEFGLSGRVDLTHPFVAASSRLLRPSGVLALLCSNRVLTTQAGQNVRKMLTDDSLHVRELYDLGDTKLFAAAVLPAVVIAAHGERGSFPAKYVSVYEQEFSEAVEAQPLFSVLSDGSSTVAAHDGKHFIVKAGTFVPPSDNRTPWRVSEPDSDRWLETLASRTWKTFGDVAKIRVGIKSTADAVFLGSDWDTTAPNVEADLLRPLITQSNVAAWRISPNLEMKVLYPYDLSSQKRQVLDLNDWPGAKAFLMRHKSVLSGREYVIAGGREWYELWVPQRPALWAEPKIVFPDISAEPRFALDTTGAVVNGNCYWISLPDVGDENVAFLMLAVANSSLGVRFYDETCGNKLYSGKRRWITQYVKRLPLPDPDTEEAKRAIQAARDLVDNPVATPERISQLDSLVEAAFAATPQRGAGTSVQGPELLA